MKFSESAAGEHNVFEAFSDMSLNFSCTLIVLVTLFCLNINQQIEIIRHSVDVRTVKIADADISQNEFSGGLSRPRLCIRASVLDSAETLPPADAFLAPLFRGSDCVIADLVSPSGVPRFSQVMYNTDTVSRVAVEPGRGQDEMFATDFLSLASGIDPGNFSVEGRTSALLLPDFSKESFQIKAPWAYGRKVTSDERLALRLMTAAWPVFADPVHFQRDFNEYRKARTRIYAETYTMTGDGGETHGVLIGNRNYPIPAAVADGTLSWLAGFSSGLTEIVHIGEYWQDAAERTDRRLDFFETEGFDDCANAYREFLFPSRWSAEEDTLFGKADWWAQLSPEARGSWERGRAGGAEEGKKAFEESVRRSIREGMRRITLSKFLKGSSRAPIPKDLLPPNLAYPEAWRAYVAQGGKPETKPPSWFFDELLQPLGFNRRVVKSAE